MAKAKKKSTSSPSADIGYHNQIAWASPKAIEGNSYKDLSTVVFYPVIADIPWRVFQSWRNLIMPMNQKVTWIPIVNQEVGKAYEAMVDLLRGNPELKKWPYVLTIETDNCPPPDGLIKLYEDIQSGPWDAVGGLYWCKGPMGKPMAYGRPSDMPRTFVPWLPPADSVSEVHGLGQGFTLFKTKIFLDDRFTRPIFQTEQSFTPGVGVRQYTQDLRFFENASKLGYRFACSTRVLVGHYDKSTDTMW